MPLDPTDPAYQAMLAQQLAAPQQTPVAPNPTATAAAWAQQQTMPAEQNAMSGDPTDYTPQQPLPGAVQTLDALGSGRAADSFADYAVANLPHTSSPVANYAMAAGVAPVMAGLHALDAYTGAARWAQDIQTGRYGTDVTDPASQAAVMPGALQTAMAMGAPGMGMAEEGALGAGGGRAVHVDPAASQFNLYHGTIAPENFSRFDPTVAARHSTDGEAGAVYFSPRPHDADRYTVPYFDEEAPYTAADLTTAGPRAFPVTMDPGKSGLMDLPQLLQNDPRFQQLVAQSGQITPEAHAGALASIQDQQAFASQAAAAGMAPPPIKLPTSFGGAASGAAIQLARERGLDSAVLRGLGENGGGDYVVALTPNRVRSAIDGSMLYAGGGSPEGAVAAGALGAAGRKAAVDDPFAAIMAALDAQAPAAAPRSMAETGIVDPSAASWQLHHGTDAAWDTFDPAKAGARTHGAEVGAMYMSPREGEASTYANGDNARVLSLQVTPGNTGVYDVAHMTATRDPRFMDYLRQESAGAGTKPGIFASALDRYDRDVAYHTDLRARMPDDVRATMPDYPAMSNLMSPQAAAVRMAREDGRDTAILRGLGESSGGDQVVALRPGFVRDAATGRQVYSGGIPGSAAALNAASPPTQPDTGDPLLAALMASRR